MLSYIIYCYGVALGFIIALNVYGYSEDSLSELLLDLDIDLKPYWFFLLAPFSMPYLVYKLLFKNNNETR